MDIPTPPDALSASILRTARSRSGVPPSGVERLAVADPVFDAVCRHCGSRVDDAATMAAGPYLHTPANGFLVHGTPVRISGQAAALLAALMAAGGNPLEAPELVAGIGSRSINPRKLVSVQLSKAKRAFKIQGLQWPVENEAGRGWRWIGPAAVRTSRLSVSPDLEVRVVSP